MNVVSAAFFLRMYVHMYVKKAAEMTFVRKKRAKNIDEIDGRLINSFKQIYLKQEIRSKIFPNFFFTRELF